MSYRKLLKILSCLLPALLYGCGYLRVDPMHFLLRSAVIESAEKEREILSKARLGWTEDGRLRVLYLKGSAYERGYQHGALLRREVQDNLGYMHKRAIETFRSEELFVEAFERARPFIPEEYLEEMHGLAHGAKVPLRMIHDIHILPSLTEWGGKKKLKGIVKQMISGELGTSCSNIGVNGSSTADQRLYAVRILDWGLHKISKLHKYPLISINLPDKGYAYANIGWVGFLGAISGMNEQGITLGEMGYGDPPNETLAGKPMPFLLRDILGYADDLADVRKFIGESPGDNSFAFLMTDGKSGSSQMYIKDHDRFVVFNPGDSFSEERTFPSVKDSVYGGHFEEKMNEMLTEFHGRLKPELFMQTIIPTIAMKSNFQNVVYDPAGLQFWVNNALSKEQRAAEQPYTFFDFGKALKEFR